MAGILLVTVFAVMAGAFLLFSQEDLSFARTQTLRLQAYWAAQAGLERYRAGALPPGALTFTLQKDPPVTCELEVKGNLLYSTGHVGQGSVISHTLMTPLWDLGKSYEP